VAGSGGQEILFSTKAKVKETHRVHGKRRGCAGAKEPVLGENRVNRFELPHLKKTQGYKVHGNSRRQNSGFYIFVSPPLFSPCAFFFCIFVAFFANFDIFQWVLKEILPNFESIHLANAQECKGQVYGDSRRQNSGFYVFFSPPLFSPCAFFCVFVAFLLFFDIF
jgi:hypothetical protein